MRQLLGISLVLALLLTINATSTMVTAGLGRLFRPLLRKCSARTRAEILFVMRIGPPVIAIVAIAAFMIPSYLLYEPHDTDEYVSWKLGTLAGLSAIGVGLAFLRGVRSWLATRSLLKQWLASSTPHHARRDQGSDFCFPTLRFRSSRSWARFARDCLSPIRCWSR